MRYCSRCGNQLSDDMIYCPKCGHKEPLDKDDKPVVIHTFNHEPKTDSINQQQTSFTTQNSNTPNIQNDKTTSILDKTVNIIQFCALVLSIVLIPFSIIGTLDKKGDGIVPSLIIGSVIIFLAVIALSINVCLYIKQKKINKGLKNTMITAIIMNCVCIIITIIQMVLLSTIQIGVFSIFIFTLFLANCIYVITLRKRKPKQTSNTEKPVDSQVK